MCMRGRKLATRAVMSCILVVTSLPVYAALTVDIVVPPTDPFTCEVNIGQDFEAVAYLDGQQLPSDEVTWDWDFGDNSDHTTSNPTVHTYEDTGNYTVTVTATHASQQGQDTTHAVVEPEQEWDGESGLFCRLSCPYPECPITGSTVCDFNYVCVRCPKSYTLQDFYMRYPYDENWTLMPHEQGDFAPQEPYAEYRAQWSLVYTAQNLPHGWKAVIQPMVGGEPEEVLGTFTPYNIVAMNRSWKVLRYDPTEDSGLDVCEIPWGTDHLVPTCPGAEEFAVCIKVFDLGGATLIWHKHLDEVAAPDSGSVSWSGETVPGIPPGNPGGPGSAPKGIYVYRVLVAHDDTLGDVMSYPDCELLEQGSYHVDLEKSIRLEITDVSLSDVEWGRPPLMEAMLHYTLSRDAGGCSLHVHKPDLSEFFIAASLPSTAGTHHVPISVLLDRAQMGPYSFVVRAYETEADGATNRDQHWRYALQKGAVEVMWPPAHGGYGNDQPGAPEALDAVCDNWNALDAAPRPVPGTEVSLRTRYSGTYGGGRYHAPVVWEGFDKCAIILTHTHANPWEVSFGHNEWLAHQIDMDANHDNDPLKQCYHIPTKPEAGLDHCLLVFYAGCNTASGQGNSPIIAATLAKGADVVAGFEGQVVTAYKPEYVEVFFASTELEGKDLTGAHADALAAVIAQFGAAGGLDTFWTNDFDLKTRPARFGQFSP